MSAKGRQEAAMSGHGDIGCEEALKRLLALIDGELSGEERDDVERHVRICRSCFSRMEFERELPAGWSFRLRWK